MTTAALRIDPRSVGAVGDGAPAAGADDRFQRFRLIPWWDQTKLAAARVLVAGAGALGNEIVKNLALLGVGNVFLADMDRIENSNLSRSILYRARDEGAHKAETAARAARDIYPPIRIQPFDGNVVHDLGAGAFRWADLVIGGLDNREARLAINRHCMRLGKTWIDGATEHLQGIVRVFAPGGPCYECTMTDADWKLLQARRSCNLLSREQMQNGATPTTPTVSSVVAGVQCQEAVKLLHGLQSLAGRGWVFDGLSTEAYQTEYQRKPDCYSHETLEQVVELDAAADSTPLAELLAGARDLLGPAARLEFTHDLLRGLSCPACGAVEPFFASLGAVSADKAACPGCGAEQRTADVFHTLRGDEPFLHLTAADIGLPPFDIVIARGGPAGRSVGFEFSGDAARVLGPLHRGNGLTFP